MKNSIFAFILAGMLALAPCVLGAAANDYDKTAARAAVVAPLEETGTEGDVTGDPGTEGGDPSENPPTGNEGEPENPGTGDEGEPENPSTGEEGNPSENPDGGQEGEDPNPPEEPEEPAAPLDTSIKTNVLGIVVLALAAVCAVLTLVLSICGKKKGAGKQKNA